MQDVSTAISSISTGRSKRSQPFQTTVDPARHGFHTKAAVAMTVSFLLALAIISLVFGTPDDDNFYSRTTRTRFLDENENNDDDYSSYSCNQLFVETSSDQMDQRCVFARTCNQGTGIFAPIVFCRTSFLSTTHWCLLLSPFFTIWLVLLFRMLGSTAEDFFSPSLEMFSNKLGLPPRFAGVSLLALGNGAADVSATISAITNDPQNGYLISLGALTGSGMFIGCVVAGMVIVASDGVRCRGALVRDVGALLITVLVVSTVLYRGTIGPQAISLFISMYMVFVLIVLLADIYHRTVVLPRLQQRNEVLERQRQLTQGKQAQEAAGAAVENLANSNGSDDVNNVNVLNQTNPFDDDYQEPNSQPFNRVITTVLGALSNYESDEFAPGAPSLGGGAPNQSASGGWGVESDDVLNERPVQLHGSNGILNKHSSSQLPGSDQDGNVEFAEVQSPYRILDDGMNNVCVEEGSYSFSSNNWTGAWQDGKQELRTHALDTWDDIVANDENNVLDKFLLICELPFSILRKVTVPIPCEGHYNRALVALSVPVSVFWIGIYAWMQHDINLFWHNDIPYVALLLIPGFAIAAMILRYGPGGDGNMTLMVAAPLALYGFVIAATWIDTIADHLVSLLDFLGIIFRIPGSIMGLTVLAWGNSMGDLSANMTMARKGLSNMAMTACFAGPVFNILVGLGFGFTALSAITGEPDTAVVAQPSTICGIVFIVLNTFMIIITGVVLNAGRIPKEYGYAAVALYVIYVVIAVTLDLKS